MCSQSPRPKQTTLGAIANIQLRWKKAYSGDLGAGGVCLVMFGRPIIDCDGPDGHGVMVMSHVMWFMIDGWLWNIQNDESDGSGVMITEFV